MRQTWTPAMIQKQAKRKKAQRKAARLKPAKRNPVKPEKRGRPRRTESDAEIDAHIGLQIKQRRAILGWSQTKLADAIGLTFQQVQKYERGTNRVGGSMMWRLSKVLAVPPSYFFDGLGAVVESEEQITTTRRVVSLAAALAKLPEHVRVELSKFTTALAHAQSTGGVK